MLITRSTIATHRAGSAPDPVRSALQQVVGQMKLPLRFDEKTMKADLKDELGLDSIDHVELVMKAEEKLGVKVPSSQYERVNTLADLEEVFRELR
ncbi:MAG: acyl carrier protein [Candidatus Eremiobacteraeota bacterium]|nr:acyl carrier protein [Candidatus Eremiobacteraeota bacterium]